MQLLKYIILISLLFTACSLERRCLKRYPLPSTTVITETVEVVVYRDTTVYVYIPADTIYHTDTILVKDDGINYPLQRLDVDYAYSIFQIRNNKLDFRLFQKDAVIAQTINKAIKESSTIEKEVVKEPYPVPAKITWWQQTMIYLGYVLFSLIVLFLGWFVIKFSLKI
jgi:hypothetical protein